MSRLSEGHSWPLREADNSPSPPLKRPSLPQRGGEDAIATDIMARMRKEAVKTSLFSGVSNLGGKCFLSNGLAKGDPSTNSEITDNIRVSSLDYPKRHFASIYQYRIQTLQKITAPLSREVHNCNIYVTGSFSEQGGVRYWVLLKSLLGRTEADLKPYLWKPPHFAFSVQLFLCFLIHWHILSLCQGEADLGWGMETWWIF